MADVVRISSASKEYVRCAITAEELGTPIDPTASTVEMAFVVPLSDPDSGDWKAASWDVDTSDPSGTIYWAQCLVGPGGAATPGDGRWTVWVRVTRGAEAPVKEVGTLIVT